MPSFHANLDQLALANRTIDVVANSRMVLSPVEEITGGGLYSPSTHPRYYNLTIARIRPLQ